MQWSCNGVLSLSKISAHLCLLTDCIPWCPVLCYPKSAVRCAAYLPDLRFHTALVFAEHRVLGSEAPAQGERAGFRKVVCQEKWGFCEENRELDGSRKIVGFWLYFQIYVSIQRAANAQRRLFRGFLVE